jgi:hypothetical protein
MEPTPFDLKLFSHPVEIVYGVGNAHQMSFVIADESHMAKIGILRVWEF